MAGKMTEELMMNRIESKDDVKDKMSLKQITAPTAGQQQPQRETCNSFLMVPLFWGGGLYYEID